MAQSPSAPTACMSAMVATRAFRHREMTEELPMIFFLKKRSIHREVTDEVQIKKQERTYREMTEGVPIKTKTREHISRDDRGVANN